MDHEERHNVNRFILDGQEHHMEKLSHKKYATVDKLSASGEESTKKQINQIHDHPSYLLTTSTTRGKDEIIAYMKDGSSLSRIKETLTQPDGLYDYWSNNHPGKLNEFLSHSQEELSTEARTLIQSKKSEYRQKHNQIIANAVDIAFQVADLDLLAVNPINTWSQLPKKSKHFQPPLKLFHRLISGSWLFFLCLCMFYFR